MVAYRGASLLLWVALVLLSPGPAAAGLQEGYIAYEQGDYQTALREFMPSALAGDPSAQFFFGVMYAEGEGVPQNDAEAVRWYRLAADQAFALAQYALGVMYGYGRGVPQDDAEAVRWFRPAADYGVPEAQFNLGVAYANGWGLPQDDVLAYMWFRLAVARSPQGDEVRERAVAKRDEVAARLSPAERARGEELERNWRSGFAARSGGGPPAYGDPGRREPPPEQRQVGPNPFRVALERQVRETQQLLAALATIRGLSTG